ncbi:uncharacterized protein LOC126899557 [Daktulosphaira vitifoliae]|uniref:Odorant binding protein 2 n=1 Tax=Daktulosphaira vitifoliae TaxID=58002 RepID=A0A1W6R6E2_DAKVI|nr:uncharacterized protein LOC126899557 [Daktulosphaira vitifoliae]ARO50001.1 odorant binding protein 2 [Daktulosphaira vitifoliae]
MNVFASTATFLVALVAVQGSDPCNISTCYTGVTKTQTSTTRLPVSSTTYAKDHTHGSTSNVTLNNTSTWTTKKISGTEPTTKKSLNVNITTSKPKLTDGHLALKQKLNTIAVKCKDELRAPQEIMALVSNTVLPQNEQQRCYLECLYKNLNLIKNNKFSVADGKMLAQIRFTNQPDELKKAISIIEICEKEAIIDPKSTEKCVAGRVIRQCFVKNGEKINFFPKA